jgi:glycosyltransferase involved in cell wall biosynthesis
MKIALIVPSVSFDGEVETPAVRLLAERLSRHVNLTVFATRYPTVKTTAIHGAIRLRTPGATNARFAVRLAATLHVVREEHARRRFDLAHALWLHEPGTIAVAAGMAFRLPAIASIGGAEVVALPEIGYGALRTRRGRLMTAHVLQQATLVTGGSEYVIRRARSVVPNRDPGRFRFLPLPVDVNAWPPERRRRFDPAAPRLLHAASLIPVKDQATLLRAFRRVVDTFQGATLTVAGEDPVGLRDSLERQRDTLGLSGSVTFIGRTPHDRMRTLYHETDLFVLSSLHESQGMVVLEAAAAGVPTAGTAVGVVPDLAPDAAVATSPGDDVALAASVIELLGDPGRLRRMGEAARRRVAEEYDAEVVVDRLLALYGEAIERRR